MTPVLTLAEAAPLLRCNTETLRRHAVDGLIPGAFKGPGGWRVPANIVELMQTARGPAPRTQEERWESAKEERSGTSVSQRQVAGELDKVLERLTGTPRKNSTTS